MTDKIVQMSVREYESLQRMAKLKEKRIQQEALKLWKERGVANIEISINYRDNHYSGYNHKVDCSAYVWCRESGFTIPEPLRSRIGKLIESFTQNKIDNYIGRPIDLWNSLELERKNLSRLSRILWLISASGWAVAAVLLCNS